jgi:mannose/fructose/N-acetylgalactosamine-specific phosphotransferase system component IIC
MSGLVYIPAAVPPSIAIAGTILGVVGFGLFIAMQVSRHELKRLALAGIALVLLFGLFQRLSADTVINDPVVALCRSLDPNENWFLWWAYDCDDVLRNAGK